jgi:uncharacterized protein YijF (DUF1287 family)
VILRLVVPIGLASILASIAFSRPTYADSCVDTLIAAAVERTKLIIRYDGSYRPISYPGGDVPDDIGVCTDLIIRCYRRIGVDLQKRVHEDMKKAFSDYPTTWDLSKPDPNIDHRRVGNLRTFLGRHGVTLPVSADPRDYSAGDLVTWSLPGDLSHIGIVSNRKTDDRKRPLIVHNIGGGPEIEDMLFEYPITGHFRYVPCGQTGMPSN